MLDLNTIKEILNTVATNEDGFTNQFIKIQDYLSEPDVFVHQAHHFNLLIKDEFIQGNVQADVEGPTTVIYQCLTLSGHQLREAMTEKSVWEKIETSVIQSGIDGLKTIPSLAVAAFMSN